MDVKMFEHLDDAQFEQAIVNELCLRYPKAIRVNVAASFSEWEFTATYRSADALKADCISMRSLDGEWIKPEPQPQPEPPPMSDVARAAFDAGAASIRVLAASLEGGQK